jgi:hypothetical protein
MKGESDETGTVAGSPFFEPDRTGPEHLIAESAETWIRRIRSPQKAAESAVDALGTYVVEFQEFLLFY